MTEIEALENKLKQILPCSNTKEQSQRRTIPIRFYVNSEEEAELNKRTPGGKGRSQYIRDRLFGYRSGRQIPQISRDIYCQISQIGSQTNQIAKAINAIECGQGLPLTEEYLEQLRQINQTLGQIRLTVVEQLQPSEKV